MTNDMNTNNAPERIELGGGYYFERLSNFVHANLYFLLDSEGRHFPSTEEPQGYLLSEVEAFAAAMQPQVSESDEAVAREIYEYVFRDGMEYASEKEDISGISRILAKHRQPAAVSADAVEVQTIAENLIDFICKPARYPIDNEVVATLQAYGDARELNGARKSESRIAMLEGLLRSVVEEDISRQTRVNIQRALSPETVCGGE